VLKSILKSTNNTYNPILFPFLPKMNFWQLLVEIHKNEVEETLPKCIFSFIRWWIHFPINLSIDFLSPSPPKKLKPFLQKLLTSKNIRLIPSFLCRSHLLKEKITSFLSYLLSNYLQQVVLSVRRCTPIPYQK